MMTKIRKKASKITAVALACALTMTAFAGCSTATDEAPEIIGASDFDCIVNEPVDLLRRVAALDREDGDITPKMDISISPAAKVNNGVATFDKTGEYTIVYSVTDSDNHTTTAECYVSVIARTVHTPFELVDMNGFSLDVAGSATLASQKVAGDGDQSNLLFKVTGAATDADAKLSRTYALQPEHEYTFKYALKSSVAGTAYVSVDGVSTELAVAEGDNELTFTCNLSNIQAPEGKDTVNIPVELLLGGLGNNIEIEFEKAEVSYPDVPNDDGSIAVALTAASVEARIDNDGGKSTLAGTVTVDNGKATLNITEVCSYGDMWRGGMFINTGINIAVGETYDISFDLESENDGPFEVCLLNSQWGPDEFICTIDDLNKNGANTYALTVPDNKAGTMWMYIRSGTNVNTITISNLSVKAPTTGATSFTPELTSSNVFDRIDNDEGKSTLAGSVNVEDGKATLNITTVCSYGDMWRGGMFINTGVSMAAGDKFDISFDLESENDGPYEVCLLNSQWGPDEFICTIDELNKNGANTYALTVPDNKAGTMWMYIRSGTNVNTITISNLKIEVAGGGGESGPHMVTTTYRCKNIYKMFAYAGAKNYAEWDNGKLVFRIEKFGIVDENDPTKFEIKDWHHKIEGPDFDMGTGSFGDYYISFKARATAPVKMVFVGPKNGGWDPNLVWAETNLSDTETMYTFKSNAMATPAAHHFEWQFGWASNMQYENVTIEISDITICYKSAID